MDVTGWVLSVLIILVSIEWVVRYIRWNNTPYYLAPKRLKQETEHLDRRIDTASDIERENRYRQEAKLQALCAHLGVSVSEVSTHFEVTKIKKKGGK